MKEIKNYKLKENPFRLAPPTNPTEIVWAGMHQLKNKLEERIKISLNTTPSRIVINWGNWGSGKTHAANFFTKTPFISNKLEANTKNIKVTLPRTSKDPVQAFLRSILGQYKLSEIQKDLIKFKDNFSEEFESILETYSYDEVIKQVLVSLIDTEDNSQPSQTTLFSEESSVINRSEKLTLIENYLYGNVTKKSLSQLNIPAGLEDDEQVVNILSAIFSCITYDKKLYKRVFLWIDEFEDIEKLSHSNQGRFTTFLRQLLDKTPNNLTIFLNFTLIGFGGFEDLSIRLGDALFSRARTKIEFEEPDTEEAKEYIKELLNNPLFRNQGDIDESNPYFPFSEAIVEYLLKNIGPLVIRKINEVFSIVLELALISDKEEIDKSFVDKLVDEGEIIAWEE